MQVETLQLKGCLCNPHPTSSVACVQVETLQLKGRHGGSLQSFAFNEINLDLQTSHALATAFAVSMRSAQPEIPTSEEHVEGGEEGGEGGLAAVNGSRGGG